MGAELCHEVPRFQYQVSLVLPPNRNPPRVPGVPGRKESSDLTNIQLDIGYVTRSHHGRRAAMALVPPDFAPPAGFSELETIETSN